jgi:hypothetical protein
VIAIAVLTTSAAYNSCLDKSIRHNDFDSEMVSGQEAIARGKSNLE